MDNTKTDRYYVESIIADLKLIVNNTRGITKEDLEKNIILCDSVLFRLIQISENTSRLSDDFKSLYADIPWQPIKGLRNRIVHNYGDVDLEVIYDTVTKDIPQLLSMMEAL